MSGRGTREAVALLTFVIGACGARSPRPVAHPDPGVLHAPGEYPGAFLDRESIVATYGARTVKFDAVLQKRQDELLLLGITPFGSRAFALKQSGLVVSFESFVPQAQSLPFPPRYMLLDVYRVFFAGLPTGGQPLADGPHMATRDGEVVTELWQDGRLRQRRFRSANPAFPDDVVVDYDGGMPAGGPPPAHIAFVNGWYGYRLDITTLGHQPL